MKSLNIKSKKGFTIIEVVLVLAIAGLIFLMVFIALPNMQMSQRNTRRRNDYSALSTMITTFVSNNNGNMPQKTDIKATWLNSEGKDPDGEAYTVGNVAACATTATGEGDSPTYCNGSTNPGRNSKQFYIYTNADCTGSKPKYKKGARNFVIYGYLEGTTGGEAAYYCLASHG